MHMHLALSSNLAVTKILVKARQETGKGNMDEDKTKRKRGRIKQQPSSSPASAPHAEGPGIRAQE